MTTQEYVSCECDAPLHVADHSGINWTGCCISCGRYSLVMQRLDSRFVISLADLHLKRGDGPDQRPLNDLSLATGLVECLKEDVWPTPAATVDFGIDTARHYGALQHAVRCGCTAYELDRVMGDGPAITKLVRLFPRQPYGPVEFRTVWDNLAHLVKNPAFTGKE